MGVFYTAGETKVRPGVYQRYSNVGGSVIAGALNGVCAIVIQADWGTLNSVTVHESSASVKETYGTGGTVDKVLQMFKGGASKVYVCRVGTGGTSGSEKLGAVTVSSKYPGTRSLGVKIAVDLVDSTIKHCYVLDGVTQLEKFDFAASSTDERDAFIAAVANSAYITATEESSAGTVTGSVTLTGTNPTVNTESYEDGCSALEPYDYNVLAFDTATAAYNNILQTYIDEIYKTGKLIIGIVGEETIGSGKVDFDTRCTHAAAFNDEKIVYMGSGWYDSENNLIDGADAVCYVAGVISATPSTQGIVHTVVKGAVDTVDKLTNAQHEKAINSGMLTLSINSSGQVWFDAGINTLITPSAEQDEGWKKIRRVKTRFELLNRMDASLAPKVGKVNCNADGIADLIQTGNGVLAAMCAEGKITSNYSIECEKYSGDSAWFTISVIDIDSLEKIYLHYQFRYSEA
jgi:hypothetical protein